MFRRCWTETTKLCFIFLDFSTCTNTLLCLGHICFQLDLHFIGILEIYSYTFQLCEHQCRLKSQLAFILMLEFLVAINRWFKCLVQQLSPLGIHAVVPQHFGQWKFHDTFNINLRLCLQEESEVLSAKIIQTVYTLAFIQRV